MDLWCKELWNFDDPDPLNFATWSRRPNFDFAIFIRCYRTEHIDTPFDSLTGFTGWIMEEDIF
jgi:hypothetical protein